MEDISKDLDNWFPALPYGHSRKTRRVPTLPGKYVDTDGHIWTLREDNVWVDEAGTWADPKFNWLLTDRKLTLIQNP